MMEKDLITQQAEIGSELDQMYSNFKKDSMTRKTESYLSKKLNKIEELWTTFFDNHLKLKDYEAIDPENDYFKTDYYNKVNLLYEKFKTTMTGLKSKLIQNVEPASISTKPPTSERSGPIPNLNFNLNGDDDGEFQDINNEQDEAVAKLVRKQKSVMQSVVHMIQDIEAKANAEHSRAYYEIKINSLQQYEKELKENDQLIWQLNTRPTIPDYEVQYYLELRDWLQDTVIQLYDKLNTNSYHNNQQVVHNNVTSTQLKLPKIVLPNFDGKYLQWVQFRDLYTQLIHEQPINNSQKMFYLTSNLAGEARRLIQHLPVTNENYETAWKILCSRYDNHRLLVTALLNKFLSQPTCQADSSAAIKSLHDVTKECIMGLSNLNISTEAWDPLLVHLLIKKFDKTTHVLYEQSLKNPRELNSLSNVLEFLETRFQSLEAIGGRSNPQVHQKSTLVAIATTKSKQCVVCKQHHPLFTCKAFLSRSASERYSILKQNNLCINCLKPGHQAADCASKTCLKCNKKHNTLIHRDESSKIISKGRNAPVKTTQGPTTTHAEPTQDFASQATTGTVTLTAQNSTLQTKYVLLSTVRIKIETQEGSEIECRAVLDSGSQMNFVTERLAKRLSLSQIKDPLDVQGIGYGKQHTNRRINMLIKSRVNNFQIRMEAHILPQIINQQPAVSLDITNWEIPNNIQLADPDFHSTSRVDLLIGAENFYQLLSIGQIKIGQNLPTLQNTVFGWVVSGKVHVALRENDPVCGICTHNDITLNDQIERFWKLEDAEGTTSTLSVAEQRCETIFNQTTSRDDSGRFVVRLPFDQDPSNLGDSRELAIARLRSVERKLAKDPKMQLQYVNFMKEYLDLGHMQEIKREDITSPHYFLPHHCVLKPDSSTTKLRVVFDASAKTTTNVSLNDILHTGPKIQEDLFAVLLRFRFPKFVFTADIEKMYRQILIHPQDKNHQLIVWREKESLPIKYYQLCTVTYGVTAAPYLAIKCLQKLASQGSERYPLGAACIRENFYVDDVIAGSNSLGEALDKQDQLNTLLKSAGFKLRKWCSNHPSLLQNIKIEDQALQLDFHDEDNNHIKTLGLSWFPRSDDFHITVSRHEEEKKVTKRRILSEIAHLFDPLGVISPVVVSAKLILKELWNQKLDWDAAVPMEIHSKWLKFRTELKALNDIKIPRHIVANKIAKTMQLHMFSDASEKAYGAAIYIRSSMTDGTIIVRLLCAKSRVAPSKKTSIPRLELCAAKLGAKLAHRVKNDLKWENQCFYWSDSTAVLSWIKSASVKHEAFIANRIAQIQEFTSSDQWSYVSTKENPADLLSRGVMPEKFKDCHKWFYGPLFLYGPKLPKPFEPKNLQVSLISSQLSSVADRLANINHQNSFYRLRRIVAYVLRFRDYYMFRNKRTGPFTAEELESALITIVRKVQQKEFAEDYANLENKTGMVNEKSPLSSLSPFLDNFGLMRVGGRLEEANLSYDAKHPILLPYGNAVTRMLFVHTHRTNAHVGPQALLAIIRQRFWPIKGKTIARSVVLDCIRCNRSNPKLFSQYMGNLPPHRVQPARPFVNSGVDFCGPFWIHYKIRGKHPTKSYVAIFCCFATKATHIEVVTDLTTEAFIGALKRFISRRGHCHTLYCDNATNFVGANNQLKELQRAIYDNESYTRIMDFCGIKGITFKFIPPRAPHFGGLWEAAVKSAKHLFKRSIARASLTYEELETVMIEIEAILNSRPLTPLSTNPNDLTALTPGHFLVGEPLTTIVDPHAHPIKGNLLYRWKLVAELKSEFWQRWTNEYLCELQHRYKWKQYKNDIKPGMMVVLKEDNVPVLSWPMGRIEDVIRGKDGLVRVVKIKTASGVVERSIHRVAPLPVQLEDPGKHDNLKQETTKRSYSESTNLDAESSVTANEESIQVQKDNANKTKRRRVNSVVSMLLMTSLVLPIVKSTQITINKFKTQPALYFEGLGTTHLVSNEWSIIVFFDMKTYWEEFSALKNGTDRLCHICNKMSDSQPCNLTLLQFSTVLNEIHNSNELLYPHANRRIKRAPLDIIGNVASSLFGVLDSNYADKMANVITNLEDNQQHLLDLLKNQTTIIDSTANIMKQSQREAEQQLHQFNMYINQTTHVINGIQQELREQRTAEIFNALSVRLILAITNYQRMQNALLDVVIDTHHGKVNPILLSPAQLQTQLSIIKEHLPTTFQLPVASNNLLELYNLMSIESRITQNQIIFRLRLPLLSTETFELLRVIPIPTWVNDTFLTVVPSSEFMIINLHRDLYYPLSEQELRRCSTIGKTTHICMQQHPLYKKGSHQGVCEYSILTHTSIPSSCKVTSSIKTPRWIQLFHPNTWIYVMEQETVINLYCGHHISQERLSGSGILQLPSGCTIKDDTAMIQAHNLYATNTTMSLIPSTNFTELLRASKITELQYSSIKHQSLITNISKLQNEISNLQLHETLITKGQTFDIHHFSLGYLTLLICLIIVSFLMWRHYKARQQHQEHQKPTPATRNRPSREFQLEFTEETV